MNQQVMKNEQVAGAGVCQKCGQLHLGPGADPECLAVLLIRYGIRSISRRAKGVMRMPSRLALPNNPLAVATSSSTDIGRAGTGDWATGCMATGAADAAGATAGGEVAGEAAGCVAAAVPSSTATTVPIGAVAPSPTRISRQLCRPSVASTSIVTLSVSTSNSRSPDLTDDIADLLEPADDLAFGDGFAELRHDDGWRPCSSLRS